MTNIGTFTTGKPAGHISLRLTILSEDHRFEGILSVRRKHEPENHYELMHSQLERKSLYSVRRIMGLLAWMGVPKTEEFNRQQNELASLARALASPSRVAILEFIYDRSRVTCSEIVDRLPLAQATVSRHLKELRENGLIEGHASGTSVIYSINRKKWDLCRSRFDRFFKR